MPGHRRWLGQTEDIEEGRRDVGEPAILDPGDRAGRVDDDERHRVQRVRGMRLAGFRVAHHFGVAVVGGDDEGMRMRSSPGNTVSRPPLKKNVTCAYFSVSAMRSCFMPALAISSPNVSLRSCGGNSVAKNGFSSSEYSVTPSAAAKAMRLARPNPEKSGSSRAPAISRMRSARKLANSTPSPSFIPL